jgi:predicted phage terminase large subunit-like protein
VKAEAEKINSIVYAAKKRLAAMDARDKLLCYAQYMSPDPNHPNDPTKSLYSVKPHHKMMAEALESVERGECLRLAISIPPQHGKSQLISRLFPSWFMGRHSHKNLMLGTYNQDFANEFGDDVRNFIESPLFSDIFPSSRLRKGSRAKDHMVTERGGKLSFLGRGGSGTGRPADGLIVDDPIKDAKEAESLTIRNDVWNWFTQVANTRCHALSFQIIVQTRWHEDDLIGRLTDPTNPHYDETVAKQWTYINIPAIMDDENVAKALGKKVGDPLWEERFPLTLLDTARRLNPIAFSALYMGKPTPPEGSFYKIDMLLGYQRHELPTNLRYYGTFDLAVSPDKDSDSSVIGNWGLDDEDTLWLLPDLYWEKKTADESVEQMIDFAKQYGWFSSYGEKGQIDRMIRPFLDKRMRERGVFFNIDSFPTTGNKGARSIAMRGRMAQGKVRFPKFAPWWARAQEQILKFTGSGNDKSDDFCDMMALMGQALSLQISADKPQQKIDVVKVGTLRWIKRQSNLEAKQNQQQVYARGM